MINHLLKEKIKSLSLMILAFVLLSGISNLSAQTSYTLQIVGGSGAPSTVDQYAETRIAGQTEWKAAYNLNQPHPWARFGITTGFLNHHPSPFEGLFTTTEYKIRVLIPEGFSNANLQYNIIADNRSNVLVNGTKINTINIAGPGVGVQRLGINHLVHAGINDISVTLIDEGGWIGINYVLRLNLNANSAPKVLLSQFYNQAPIVFAGADQVIDGGCSSSLATVTLSGKATDTEGENLTYSWSNGETAKTQTLTLAPGVYTFTLTATDESGKSSTDDVKITVKGDVTPPSIVASTSKLTFWPPNHEYQTVSLSSLGFTVSDNCASLNASDLVITKVTSDELEDADDDGSTLNDIVISPDFTSVQLRRERSGVKNGRVYRIHVGISDGNGNIGTASVTVNVPVGKKDAVIEDAPLYTVEGGTVNTVIANNNQEGNAGLAKNGALVPDQLELKQNFPNPFNPSTTISFSTPNSGFYSLKVYNLLGQEVANLFTGELESGIYNFNFDASKLSSGLYIYSLKGKDVNISKKMNLMK